MTAVLHSRDHVDVYCSMTPGDRIEVLGDLERKGPTLVRFHGRSGAVFVDTADLPDLLRALAPGLQALVEEFRMNARNVLPTNPDENTYSPEEERDEVEAWTWVAASDALAALLGMAKIGDDF